MIDFSAGDQYSFYLRTLHHSFCSLSNITTALLFATHTLLYYASCCCFSHLCCTYFLSLFDISKLFAPLPSQTHYAFPNKNLPRNDSMKEEQRASHTVTCAPLTPTPVSHLPTFSRGFSVPLHRQRAVGTAFVNEKLITASRCFGVISTA